MLVLVAGLMLYQSVERLIEPTTIHYDQAIAIAAVGLLVNLVCAWLDGIAEALPLNDNSFDFAIMVTVVCFLDDVAQAFSEACRILKPNGTLVVGFIDRESELGKIYEQKKERSQFYRDATFYSVSELERLLTNAGFSSCTYRQTLLPGEPICLSDLEGYGSGGFVVVRAVNKKEGGHK